MMRVTSAVIEIPCALAHLTGSTVPSVEAWQMRTPRRRRGPAVRRARRSTLGGTWPAGQTQPGRGRAFVGKRTDGQPRLLGVLGDEDVEALGVFEGAAHRQRVVDAFAVVAEHLHLGRTRSHHAHLGELFALGPTVTAPTGCTSTNPTSRPVRYTLSVTVELSATGSVLAIANTAV